MKIVHLQNIQSRGGVITHERFIHMGYIFIELISHLEQFDMTQIGSRIYVSIICAVASLYITILRAPLAYS